MSSGMNTPVGMSVRTPNTVTQEGGIASGSFSIQSMNTSVLNQMYQNTANIWGSLTEFGNEMFDLAYKYTMYKAKKKAKRGKAEDEGILNAASDPQAKEDHDTARAIEVQEEGKRESTGSGSLGSHQSRFDKQKIKTSNIKEQKTEVQEPVVQDKDTEEVLEEIGAGEITGPPANLAKQQTVQVVDEEMKRLHEEEEEAFYDEGLDMPRGVH